MRVLTYFNLPYDDIISQHIKPTLIFDKELRSDQKNQDPINKMLNEFEIQKKD
jgi:hypothetical protein